MNKPPVKRDGRIAVISGQMGLCSGEYHYHLEERPSLENGFKVALLTGKKDKIPTDAMIDLLSQQYLIQTRLKLPPNMPILSKD